MLPSLAKETLQMCSSEGSCDGEVILGHRGSSGRHVITRVRIRGRQQDSKVDVTTKAEGQRNRWEGAVSLALTWRKGNKFSPEASGRNTALGTQATF